MRRMFADVDADIYVMADGDLTYDPKAAPAMVAMLVDEQLDMVVGTRQHEVDRRLSRRSCARQQALHRAARGAVRAQFHRHFLGLSRVLAALRQELPGAVGGVRDRDRDERPRARAAGCRSAKSRRPMARGPRGRRRSCRPIATAGASSRRSPRSTASSGRCCSSARSARCCWSPRLVLAVPLVLTYLDTGLVPRFPTAILITGMTIVAVLCFFAGLILDTVTRGRREVRRLAYLAHPAPEPLSCRRFAQLLRNCRSRRVTALGLFQSVPYCYCPVSTPRLAAAADNGGIRHEQRPSRFLRARRRSPRC